MNDARPLQSGIKFKNIGQRLAHQRHVAEIDDVEKFGPEAVINVMGVVGDVIGDGGNLGFHRSKACKLEIVHFGILDDHLRQAAYLEMRQGRGRGNRSAGHCA